MGLQVMDNVKAFYFLHIYDHLKGAVLIHVDEFNLAGTEEFVDKVLE